MDSIKIEQAAAEWLAQLDRSDVPSEIQAAFERWRDASPRHAAAYLRLFAAWQRLDRLRALRPPGAGGLDADYLRDGGADAVQASAPTIPRSHSRPLSRTPWRAAAAMAAIAIVTAAVVLLQSQRNVDLYATKTGGFERVQLRDGSSLELNTDTQVRVDFTGTARRIDLLRGEATFTVAHDAQRPFIVTAEGTSVRAVGTQFTVRRHSRSIDLLVTEGKVVVGSVPAIRQTESGQAESAALARLPTVAAGQFARVTTEHVSVQPVSQTDADRALAWQTGMLEFESSTLARVVAEFNRYNLRQLVVEDPALARLQIGGHFKTTNLDGFVRVLEEDFGVRAEYRGEQIVLREQHLSEVPPVEARLTHF